MHNLEGEISQRFDEIKYAGSLVWVIDPFLARPEDGRFIFIKRSRRGINKSTNEYASETIIR